MKALPVPSVAPFKATSLAPDQGLAPTLRRPRGHKEAPALVGRKVWEPVWEGLRRPAAARCENAPTRLEAPFFQGPPLCTLEPPGELAKVNFFPISSPKHFQIPSPPGQR